MSRKNVLVLAQFDNEIEADQAVTSLQRWEQVHTQVKLGGIGVLVKDENGQVKEHKLGPRQGWKGSGIGAVLGVAAAIPTGGLSLVPGIASGAIAGGLAGAFFKKGFHELTKDDAEAIDQQLNDGRAVVGVLVSKDDADIVSTELTTYGGTLDMKILSDATLKDAAAATNNIAAPPPNLEMPPSSPSP
jgi:uncharacterized membrane protein